MNERDSETIAGLLEQLGYVCADDEQAPSSLALSSEDSDQLPSVELKSKSKHTITSERNAADIIVINTCSVRENADNRFFGVLGQIKKSKEADSAKLVAVCGCMLQQDGIRNEIANKFPWVDIVFGTHNIDELPRLIDIALANRDKGKKKTASHLASEDSERKDGNENVAILDSRERAWHVMDDTPDIIEGLPSKRAYPFKAFVNIIYGCNNFCTYCIVPYTRGREKSRGPEKIASEVASLCADGVKEITLLGQNVNSYSGLSADGTLFNFPDLLRLVAGAPGLERLRFMTSHPKDVSDELIKLFADLPKLCPSIHLPVQSGSTDVLRRMNRRYTKEDYLSLIGRLRMANPDIVITTDLIVGFPGESDKDFEETMDIIERARFDSAFTFLYSPRSGTPAADYDAQVPDEKKHQRFNRMTELLNVISLEKNNAYVGRIVSVLAEGASKKQSGMIAGRTRGGKLVNFSAECLPETLAGHIVDVRITDAGTFSLIGQVLL